MAKTRAARRNGKQVVDRQSRLWLEWQENPGLFMQEALGMSIWSKQNEIGESVRDVPETMVPSCNGAGKTEVSAALVLQRGLCYKGIVLTTAPTWRQVVSVLWERVRKLSNNAPVHLGIDVGSAGFHIDDNWFAMGLSTNQPARFQGFHDDNVTVIVEEAGDPLIGPAMWEAFDGCLTGSDDRLLGIGNPTVRESEFFLRCSRWAPHRRTIRISAYQTPNVRAGRIVIPNLVSKEFVKRKEHDWTRESPAFQSRILGLFPEVSSDALFPNAWVAAALNYRIKDQPEFHPDTGDLVAPAQPDLDTYDPADVQMGVDVARYGSDASAIALRRGGKLHGMIVLHGKSTMQTAGRALANIRAWKPETVYVDSVGLGAGTYDRVVEQVGIEDGIQDVDVLEFSAGITAPDPQRFDNLKSQAYWHFRELLREGKVDLSALTRAQKDVVEAQAMHITYEHMSSGKVKVGGKEAVKKKLGRSCDELEAIIMAYWDAGYATPDLDLYQQEGPHDTNDYFTGEWGEEVGTSYGT